MLGASLAVHPLQAVSFLRPREVVRRYRCPLSWRRLGSCCWVCPVRRNPSGPARLIFLPCVSSSDHSWGTTDFSNTTAKDELCDQWAENEISHLTDTRPAKAVERGRKHWPPGCSLLSRPSASAIGPSILSRGPFRRTGVAQTWGRPRCSRRASKSYRGLRTSQQPSGPTSAVC